MYIHRHAQNLNTTDYRDEEGRYRERITGPMWKNGRGWIRWGATEDTYPMSEVRAEWHVRKPVYLLGFDVGIGGGDSNLEITASLWVWPVSLYAGMDLRRTRSLVRRITKGRWDGEREIAVRLARADGGTWRWSFWHPTDSWSSKTPKWRNGSWCPLTSILGRWEFSEEVLGTTQAVVPMPEGTYPATVTMDRATWRRKRFPFISKTMLGAKVEVEGGIGHPGKGENAWDCGDDAIYSISCRAATVEEAIGQMVASVLRNRMKYGGSHEFTPSELAA